MQSEFLTWFFPSQYYPFAFISSIANELEHKISTFVINIASYMNACNGK
jgi:hypothetical protein